MDLAGEKQQAPGLVQPPRIFLGICHPRLSGDPEHETEGPRVQAGRGACFRVEAFLPAVDRCTNA